MSVPAKITFSEEEIDTLQEVMNIAFGSAVADLAEMINIYVVLSVPKVKVLPATELLDYIKTEVVDYRCVTVVEQDFLAKFKGLALLVFPKTAGKSLAAMLENDVSGASGQFGQQEVLENETFKEVSNILVGACISKVAELLGDCVIYSPPRLVEQDFRNKGIAGALFASNYPAIILHTVFHFDEQEVKGYLFIVIHESAAWLRTALGAFMEQFT